MFKIKSLWLEVASVIAVTTIAFSLLIPAASAETIEAQTVQDQRIVVMTSLVSTLQEDVTLLQMLFIRKLEARVNLLQTLVDAQA